jgi:hypothetical protein
MSTIMPARRPTSSVLSKPRAEYQGSEVAVARAFLVWALAEHGEGDVPRMKVGQLADLRRNPGAPFALLRRRAARAPYKVISDEQPATLKGGLWVASHLVV